MNLNCTICSELLLPTDDIQITPCGHIFHKICIQTWFKRSKSCPQCRNKCSMKSIHKVFFNTSTMDKNSKIDVGLLQTKLNMSRLTCGINESKLKKSKNDINELKTNQKKYMKIINGMKKQVDDSNFLVQTYNEQFKTFNHYSNLVKEQQKQIAELKEILNLICSKPTET